MLSLEPIESIIITWVGPFAPEELSRADSPNVLYMIAGKKKYGKKMRILYIGITKRTAQERIREHKISPSKALIRWDTAQIWVGHIQHPTECGSVTLGLAEHYLIHYAGDILNTKKVGLPSKTACIVSQWRKQDGKPYQQKQPIHEGLPDVIWWDKQHWRCGNLSISSGN